MSAQTFGRTYKTRIQLEKTPYRFSDFINRKYFTLILKMMILISCTGKFCYRYRNFQNIETATPGILKIQFKVSQDQRENTHAELSLLKKRLRHRCFPVNFVKFLRTSVWKATVSQNKKGYMRWRLTVI